MHYFHEMKSYRIFIQHLPETASETEIHSKFSEFGVVRSAEIKERKNVTFKNSSVFFAYINLETDENRLQKCFQYFNDCPWNGEYVKLQIAKESFLERLKREREANHGKALSGCSTEIKTSVTIYPNKDKSETGFVSDESKQYQKKNNKIAELKKRIPSTSSSDDSCDLRNDSVQTEMSTLNSNCEFINEEPELQMIIKSNKGKMLESKKLEIESVGQKPVFSTDIGQHKPKSLDKFRTEADNKRLLSMLKKKKEYNHQKNTIQAALSYTNINKSNKIIFNQRDGRENHNHVVLSEIQSRHPLKTPLFDNERNSESDEDSNKIFELKDKFQGRAGEKLLKLQSTFKNDKRFVLNEKFLEDTQNEQIIADDSEVNNIEEEKKKEFEILGEILGREMKSYRGKNEKHTRSQNEIKVMRRFDPSHPSHMKYERENDKTSIKRKKEYQSNEKKVDDKEEPEVSKEVFYAVRDDLKKSLDEDKSFSLLSTFGISHEKEDIADGGAAIPIEKKKYINSDNPFKYDSSDDEDQTEQLPHIENSFSKVATSIKAWTEPFFFQEDDFRLQEGLDFVKRLATEDKADFLQVRRNLKEIARNKVRMNLRKNRPFKKKLGGNKKKKIKRFNKALKR